jgi:predicted acylesterase/phospholipase RssA
VTATTRRKRVLSFDGGGAKGVYSLGFLSRLEAQLGSPLCNHFDLVYGTSTGSLIACLVSLGCPVAQIYSQYLEKIPTILNGFCARSRSRNLRNAIDDLLGKSSYSDLRCYTGIVATNWEKKQPLIFKNYAGMVHSGTKTFVPGHGVPLADALQASCSAYPLFKPVPVRLENQGGVQVHAYDGGFCANNPAAFALMDAKQLGWDLSQVVLISVGVGHYPKPPKRNFARLGIAFVSLLPSARLSQAILEISSNTSTITQEFIDKTLLSFRADDRFDLPELGTDLLETNVEKLRNLYAQGTLTFQKNEKTILGIL